MLPFVPYTALFPCWAVATCSCRRRPPASQQCHHSPFRFSLFAVMTTHCFLDMYLATHTECVLAVFLFPSVSFLSLMLTFFLSSTPYYHMILYCCYSYICMWYHRVFHPGVSFLSLRPCVRSWIAAIRYWLYSPSPASNETTHYTIRQRHSTARHFKKIWI